jgi:hypothetical protein
VVPVALFATMMTKSTRLILRLLSNHRVFIFGDDVIAIFFLRND